MKSPSPTLRIGRESISPTASLTSNPVDFIFADSKPPYVKNGDKARSFGTSGRFPQSQPQQIHYPIPKYSNYSGVGGELYDMTGRSCDDGAFFAGQVAGGHPPLHHLHSTSPSRPTPPGDSPSATRWEGTASVSSSRRVSDARAEMRSSRYEGRRARWITETEEKKAEEERRNKEAMARKAREADMARLEDEMRHNHKKEGLMMMEKNAFTLDSPKAILYSMRRYCLSKPVHKFKDLFMQYDEDGNGTLDFEEIHHGIQRMGYDIDIDRATEVMKMIDLDGNECLDFAEFRCAILDERIAKDFEEHERRMYNDCKLQDEYRERCMQEPYSASVIGPACKAKPSKGHLYHFELLKEMKEGMRPMMTTKEMTVVDLEKKRLQLQEELAEEKRLETIAHGKKDSSQKKEFLENMDTKFKNLRQAFSKMDKDSSGTLDSEEMKQVCLDLNLPESWVGALIEDSDIDGDGEISYTEFVKALTHKSHVAAEEEVFPGDSSPESSVSEHHLFGDVAGNFNFREGPPVPAAMPKAGGWDTRTRQYKSKKPLLFNAHASHIDHGAVLEDGVTALCTRPLSYNVKATAPNFLK
jgi:Ca2+-binding EF-hand superfamily protein